MRSSVGRRFLDLDDLTLTGVGIDVPMFHITQLQRGYFTPKKGHQFQPLLKGNYLMWGLISVIFKLVHHSNLSIIQPDNRRIVKEFMEVSSSWIPLSLLVLE